LRQRGTIARPPGAARGEERLFWVSHFLLKAKSQNWREHKISAKMMPLVSKTDFITYFGQKFGSQSFKNEIESLLPE
jgi:hypothetical protein